MTHNPNNTVDETTGQARPPKPIPLLVIPDNIPAELKALNQWLIWRYFYKSDLGYWDKPPLDANRNGNAAKSTDPKTWATFEKALSTCHLGNFDGIGITLIDKNGLVGFDLDDCRDPETRDLAPWAQFIVEQLPTYWEISPSGTGLRGFGYGRKPGSRCRAGDFEMYVSGRYLCITGHHLKGTPASIQAVQAGIDAVYAQIFPPQARQTSRNGDSPSNNDEAILQHARGARNAAKFCTLFDDGDTSFYEGDHSRADLALCRLIAFYTQIPEQVDRIFRLSALSRPKWDRADYRDWTIAKAIESAPEHWRGMSTERNGQPHENGAGDERNASSNRDTPPVTLTDVEQVFKKWLNTPDLGLVRVQLGAVAGNLIEGADPVWLMEIGGSGWGKTEHLQSASELPFIHVAATLTEAALLSGTPRKEKAATAKGGLLREIDKFGVLILKDFTSILAMHRDQRAAVLAALREIYDGQWTRHVGVDGGRTLLWEGKIGIIAGVTSTIDRHHTVISTMGERFIFYRLPSPDEEAQAKQGLKNVGKEKLMRAELSRVVKGLFAGLPEAIPTAELSDPEETQLIAWARLAARCRSPIERDTYATREIELIPDPEAPVRLAQILLRLFSGMLAIGVPRPDAWKLIKKVSFDCMPAIRCKVLQFILLSQDPKPSTTTIATSGGYPTETARRALEDLTAHGILKRHSQGKGNPDLWELSDLTKRLTGTVPEMSEGR